MIGGNKSIDRIKVVLRNTLNQELLPVYIDVYDNSLSHKWLQSLNNLLAANYHLEKNYCFFGFEKNARNLEYMCNEINSSIQAINESDVDYFINDYFSPENTVQSGPVGRGMPGLKINHDKFNQLHRYFEDLQGESTAISQHYKGADAETRYHIRQLNLLCHEAESWILSARKAVSAPDWRRPSQLMCWLNAPRFILDKNDYELFGIDALNRDLGGVFVGVNKAVGKHHWEVYTDEGRDSRIDELTTTSLKPQTEASGDFDIEWALNPHNEDFWNREIKDFKKWLKNNGFDYKDKSLTIGHPQVGQVDLQASFGSTDHDVIWTILSHYLDVYSIETNDANNVFDYHWSDDNYKDTQVRILGERCG